MPGGVLATSGEVGKASEEACGVLTVSNKIAPAAPKRRARGGKASRARRLENFRQHKAAAPAAAPAIKWEQLAHGLLRQQRATLRDGARAAWVRMRAARAKIGAAVRSAWRCVRLCSRVTSSPFPLLDPTLGPLMSSAAHVLLVCVLWALLVSAIDRVR